MLSKKVLFIFGILSLIVLCSCIAVSVMLSRSKWDKDPCRTEGILADDEYCDSYWICENEKPVFRSCNNGLVFAGKGKGILDGCDYPWKSNFCQNKIRRKTPITTENCEWSFGVFEHLFCDRYWSCWNNTATENECPDGLLYNNETHLCDRPENVKCKTQNPCKIKSAVADYKNCDKYWVCNEGKPVQRSCHNGLVFAGEGKGIINGCDYPWKSNYCQNKTRAMSPIRRHKCEWSFDVFEHPSCDRYWSCWNSTATEHKCPDGLLYNNEIHLCDWPENVKCKIKNSTSDEAEDEESDFSDGLYLDYVYSDEELPLLTTPAIPKTTSRINIRIISSNLCDESYPIYRGKEQDIFSCHRYWWCDNGWPRFRRCHYGTVFDRDSRQCVTPPTPDCPEALTLPPPIATQSTESTPLTTLS